MVGTSPFFFALTTGVPRMEAAVAEPCGLLRAGAFLFVIFLCVVTVLPIWRLSSSLPQPEQVHLRVGECSKVKEFSYNFFSKIFSPSRCRHKRCGCGCFRDLQLPPCTT